VAHPIQLDAARRLSKAEWPDQRTANGTAGVPLGNWRGERRQLYTDEQQAARDGSGLNYAFIACSIATATATDAPTMGLLPMPIKPIISTCAGTEDDPANWASECMRPMVSVMP